VPDLGEIEMEKPPSSEVEQLSFHESLGSSCSCSEDAHKWAPDTKLWFSDDHEWKHYQPDGKSGSVNLWVNDCGAMFVRNKNACTHMVLNYVKTGSARRDNCASEDMRGTQNSRIGRLLNTET